MSDVLVRLTRMYKEHEGITIATGFNSTHFAGYPYAPFTHFLKDGKNLTQHLGISIWEVMLLERLCGRLQPRRIYIVGNGLGWSALALALINPEAKIVTVDPESGIELTNRIANAEGLNCVVRPGFSPQDNDRIISEEFGELPDFCFIDGLHTNENVLADWRSLFEICGDRAVYMFHDVVLFNLFSALNTIGREAQDHGMKLSHLFATPSGMSALYPDTIDPEARALMQVFGGTAQTIAMLNGRAERVKHQPRQMFVIKRQSPAPPS